MVRTLVHGHRYDGSRAERELGLRYTDPRETIRRTVTWAREWDCCGTCEGRVMPEGSARPVNGARIHIDERRTGAPILCIHGAGARRSCGTTRSSSWRGSGG